MVEGWNDPVPGWMLGDVVRWRDALYAIAYGTDVSGVFELVVSETDTVALGALVEASFVPMFHPQTLGASEDLLFIGGWTDVPDQLVSSAPELLDLPVEQLHRMSPWELAGYEVLEMSLRARPVVESYGLEGVVTSLEPPEQPTQLFSSVTGVAMAGGTMWTVIGDGGTSADVSYPAALSIFEYGADRWTDQGTVIEELPEHCTFVFDSFEGFIHLVISNPNGHLLHWNNGNLKRLPVEGTAVGIDQFGWITVISRERQVLRVALNDNRIINKDVKGEVIGSVTGDGSLIVLYEGEYRILAPDKTK